MFFQVSFVGALVGCIFGVIGEGFRVNEPEKKHLKVMLNLYALVFGALLGSTSAFSS